LTTISFFRPEFLWVLLFVIAVIVLHLIRRPTFKILPFSTLMFFTSDAVVSSKSRRIFKLLQLLMRILALIAIILLFARPYQKDNVLGAINNPTTPLYFWIDNTISMSYVKDSGTLSDIALNCVRKAASFKSANTVYLYSNEAQEFISVDDSIGTDDKHFGEISFQHAIHSFSDVSKENGNAVLFVMSDFQKQSAEYIDSILNESGSRLKNGIVLLSVTPQEPYNIAIHDASVQNGTVSGFLRQYGGKKDTLHVNCIVDGVNKGEVAVVAQRDSTMSFTIETGVNLKVNGYLQIQESDPLQFDNTFYFTDRFKGEKKICIIGDTIANYTIRAAIHAADNNTIISLYPERAVTFDILDSSDVIILNALKHPCGALNAFVMSKGTQCKSIICCVDPAENYCGYYRDILSKALNDGALKLQADYNSKANPVLNDTLTAMWNKFRSLKIDDAEIYSYVKGINGTILLRYTTNDPLIIHKQDQEKRDWVIVTTSLGITVDNNLFQSSFYLPMIDRMLAFASSVKKNSDLVWACGKEIKNPFFNIRKDNLLYNSRGDFIENLSGLSKLYLGEPGIYKVVSGNSDVVFVKVQYDSLESRLQYISPKSIKGNNKNTYTSSSEELLQVFDSNKTIGIEMLLWIFLTLFLLGEIIFSIRR
jgi:Aerotolerance regulator N-terminal